MKKIFTLLSIVALSSVTFAQKQELSVQKSPYKMNVVKSSESKANEYVLKQYTSDVPRESIVSCSDPNGVENHFSRLFDLAAAGITEEFNVKSVTVMGAGSGDILELAFAEISGAYTAASINAGLGDGYGSYIYSKGQTEFPEIELDNPQTVAPGKKLAVALVTTLFNNGQGISGGVFLGNNEAPQTAPTYIGWPNTGCDVDDMGNPIDIAELNFKQSMIFHVTGTTESMGTVELGSTKLAVYPNPATTEVNIKLGGSKVADVTVADVTGRVIPVKFSKDGKVDTSRLSAGVYFLRVKDDKGVTRIQKIIKK